MLLRINRSSFQTIVGGNWRPERIVFLMVTLVLSILILVPLAVMLFATFSTGFESLGQVFTLQNYFKTYSNPRYYVDLWNTIFLAGTVTVSATAIGMFLAWVVGRTNVPGARFIELLVVLPLFVSPFLGALGWAVAVRPGSGLIGKIVQEISSNLKIDLFSVQGMIWVLSLYMVPYAFVFVVASLRAMDPALEQAASMVGLGTFKTVRRITFPLVAPAILSAALLIFVSVIGQFQVPAILGSPANFFVITTRIFALTQNYPTDWPAAASLGTMILIVSMIGVYLQVKALGKGVRSFATVTGRGYRPGRINLGRKRHAAAAMAWAYILVAVVVPIGTLVYTSFLPEFSGQYSLDHLTFANYLNVLTDSAQLRVSIFNTLLIAVLAATLSLVLTAIASYIICRSRTRGGRILEFVCTVPSAIPGTVLAVAFLWSFVLTPLYNTMWILVLAYTAGFVPYGIRTILPSLRQIDQSLEEAGSMSGLGWFRVVGQILVPLIRPNLISAWLLFFLLFVKELNLSVMLASDGTKVLSVAIYEVWSSGKYHQAATLATVQVTLIALVVILVNRILGTRSSSAAHIS